MENDKSEYHNYQAEKNRDRYFKYLAEKLREFGLEIQGELFDFNDGEICGQMDDASFFGIILRPAYAIGHKIIEMQVWLEEQKDKIGIAEKLSKFFGAPPVYSYYEANKPAKIHYIWNSYPKSIDYGNKNAGRNNFVFTDFRLSEAELPDLTIDNLFTLQSMLKGSRLLAANLHRIFQPNITIFSVEGILEEGGENFFLQAFPVSPDSNKCEHVRLYFKDGRGDAYAKRFSSLFAGHLFAYQIIGWPGHFYSWRQKMDEKKLEKFWDNRKIFNRRYPRADGGFGSDSEK